MESNNDKVEKALDKLDERLTSIESLIKEFEPYLKEKEKPEDYHDPYYDVPRSGMT